MNKKILRIILIILIIFWMYTVFGFSNAGADESSGLSEMIARVFTNNEQYVHLVESVIRKIAHLSEYALGGILIYGLFLTFELESKIQVLGAWSVTTIYAITDEIHQLFIPGRAGKISDVYIDTLGVMIGICLILLCIKLFEYIKNKNTDIKTD